MNIPALTTLKERRFHIGTWLSIGSPVIAELAAECGFEWLLFDLEHGCGSEATLFSNLQAIRHTSAAGIVRVGAPTADLILRVLDWGAEGIMVPHVSSREEALRCVEAVHYAPRGSRGFSRSARTYGYGLRAPKANEPIPGPAIIAQIESVKGVENAAEIAAVEGIDVLFVGPADLNFDLQTGGSSREFSSCLAEVLEAAAQAGKQAGILVRNREDIPQYAAMGFQFVAVDSDLAILRQTYLDLLQTTRGGSHL